jgi:small subunit ribosomal protein S20
MANTKSALKRVRQIERRTERNRADKSRLKTLRKKIAVAIDGGKADEAETAFRDFASAVDKAAKTNLIHKNAASRLKSNASAQVAKGKA